MNTILATEKSVFAFIDDILIVTTGKKSDHLEHVKKILKRLDDENVRLKLEKCEFAEKDISWLGYKIPQSGKNRKIAKFRP